MALPKETVVDSFEDWARKAEPKLRNALTAAFGVQVGRDAAVDALSFAWEHWDRVSRKPNPVGYVFGVGRNRARRQVGRTWVRFLDVPEDRLPHVEPALPAAMASLSEKQRVTVTLLYGYSWTMSEVAELLGTRKTTVQNHAERGLTHLRRKLGVTT